MAIRTYSGASPSYDINREVCGDIFGGQHKDPKDTKTLLGAKDTKTFWMPKDTKDTKTFWIPDTNPPRPP